MFIEKMVVGPLYTNCYILGSTKGAACIVIDPGAEYERIINSLQRFELKAEHIIVTHGHYDHIGAAFKLGTSLKAGVLMHPLDEELLSDAKKNLSFWFDKEEKYPSEYTPVTDGEMIDFSSISARIIHTPGHSPGSISVLVDKHLFTGDLLFAGSVGRTDLPGASQVMLLKSLKEKILSLDEDIAIYPGHGPETSLRDEKNNNPYLKQLL